MAGEPVLGAEPSADRGPDVVAEEGDWELLSAVSGACEVWSAGGCDADVGADERVAAGFRAGSEPGVGGADGSVAGAGAELSVSSVSSACAAGAAGAGADVVFDAGGLAEVGSLEESVFAPESVAWPIPRSP